ncbi:unnamed protein product, partial [Protopolystoma xenopodis]
LLRLQVRDACFVVVARLFQLLKRLQASAQTFAAVEPTKFRLASAIMPRRPYSQDPTELRPLQPFDLSSHATTGNHAASAKRRNVSRASEKIQAWLAATRGLLDATAESSIRSQRNSGRADSSEFQGFREKSTRVDQSANGRLPAYVERVPLARRKQPQSRLITILEVGLVISVFSLAGLAVIFRDDLHIILLKLYAHAGVMLGHNYLNGRLTGGPDLGQAVVWLRKAAEKGHSRAAYNLAAARLKGAVSDEMVSRHEATHWLQTLASTSNTEDKSEERLQARAACARGYCLQ